MEQIIEIQEQHTVLLNNIYRNQETQNISVIKRPTVVPNLPVTTKAEYKELEEFLKIKDNFDYMVRV